MQRGAREQPAAGATQVSNGNDMARPAVYTQYKRVLSSHLCSMLSRLWHH